MNSKHLSVLVIEDNDGDFVLVEDYLIEAYKTIRVARFESFSELKMHVEANTEFNYDLILLDLNLPDNSGKELILDTLSFNIRVPIIILTGYTDLSMAKESLKLGVDDFLIKDEVTPNILFKSIEFAFSRNLYIQQIQKQNEKLKNIAWIQSHVVRAPLSRILGIIDLIEAQQDDLEDLMFLLIQLRISSNEMDGIVRKITEEAQEFNLNNN